jgi:hypothetical protein
VNEAFNNRDVFRITREEIRRRFTQIIQKISVHLRLSASNISLQLIIENKSIWIRRGTEQRDTTTPCGTIYRLPSTVYFFQDQRDDEARLRAGFRM